MVGSAIPRCGIIYFSIQYGIEVLEEFWVQLAKLCEKDSDEFCGVAPKAGCSASGEF